MSTHRLAIAVLAAAGLALLFATPAWAAKKKRHRQTGLALVVLNFTGKNTGGADAKEALELELELVDSVQVGASDTLQNDVQAVGKRAFDASVLSGLMQKHKVDILVRGERGRGEKELDALLVTAFGKDGQPRFFKELPLGREPDETAGAIAADLKTALASWKAQKPIKLPSPDDAADTGHSKISAADVLADDDPDKHAPPPPPKKAAASGRVTSAIDDDDDPPPAAPKKADKKASAASSSDGSPLDFNNDPADTPKKHRASVDDDSPPEKVARSDIDDSGRRHTIDDVSDAAKDADQPAKLAHALAISGAFDGATWYYAFDGGGVGDTAVAATFYPGGSASVDFWPLKFLGVDAELGLAAVPFKISGGDVAVTPSEFTAIQTRAAVALKGRYTLKNGIGLGVRLGYRYYGASVQLQTINVDGKTQDLTIVPGFDLHAGSIGAEIFLPILFGSHRLELELHADGLPITYYDEHPDNPGANTLAFGWSASFAARYDVASGFFLELRGQSTGASINYTDRGSRVALVGQQIKQLQGGNVLNLTAGFSAGIGLMF